MPDFRLPRTSACQRILRLRNRSGLTLDYQRGKRLRDRADHWRTVLYRVARFTTCSVRAVEQLIRATCPARAAGQRTHTLSRTGENRKCSNRTRGANGDALSQTSLVRVTHGEGRGTEWRRNDKREDERKSWTLGTKGKTQYVVYDYD